MSLTPHPEDGFRRWDEAQVLSWLRDSGFSKYEQVFLENDITSGQILCELTYALLRELGIPTVGDRVRIITSVKQLRRQSTAPKRSLFDGNISDGNSLTSESTLADPRAPAAPETPNRSDSEAIKQSIIRVTGEEGATCHVDVRNATDAQSILTLILHKFHINDDPSKYQLFIASGESARGLSDAELVTICKTPNRPEKERLILRKRYQPLRPGGDASSATPGAKINGHRNSFVGMERPASELISMNLAQFFPDSKKDELENVGKVIRRNSKIGGKRMPTWGGLTASEDVIPEGDEDAPEKLTSEAKIAAEDKEISDPEDGYESTALSEEDDTDDKQSISSTANFSHVDSESQENTSGSIVKWMKGSLLGMGSYGSVYLGLNQLNGELFAAKQVELDKGNDNRKQMMLRALQREIDLLKNLDHENIVRYLEYVPGGSVVTQLARGKFPESRVKSYTRQILQGLSYLHEKDIIHRDIKGGNILVDNKGIIKISDFGISQKVEGNPQVLENTHRASLQGMAPEVVQRQLYTKKADIWSLGCLVIEMFTGDHPFPKFTPEQAIFKIGTYSAPDLPEKLSREAEDFILQTFDRDYNTRQSALELLKHPFVKGEVN